ncbi:MAG: hypothetical protein UZ05_CHB002000280 [Chlorobi bacterium OLB5]|nr:MAG: hypothetical protein UZ05_CHB002000280 [Chlorobi bacterium OLB5]
MENRPQAIIVTFPVQFLIDLSMSYKPWIRRRKDKILHGFKECIHQIEFCNSDPEDYWSHIMGNVPVEAVRENITHCYINILSKKGTELK